MNMKQNKLLIIGLIIFYCMPVAAQPASEVEMKTFINALMRKMTLDEKLGQLNLSGSDNPDIDQGIRAGKIGALINVKSVQKVKALQKVAVEESRLKIPMIFSLDVANGYETVFPIPLGLSSSWDLNIIERSARIIAQEASADGIFLTFSPTVDIARDPRWGRIAEGSGEDPYLGYQIAKAWVKGYQGDLSKNHNIMACVKHFALYGAAEAGRDFNTTDMSYPRMFNEYLLPYKGAIDADTGCVMASFNDVNGIPATANKFLLTDVLRKQWGYKGFVVSDYTGINEMEAHGLGDLKTVSVLALEAGTNMDMVGRGFLTTLKQSLNQGKITLWEIDNSCRLILEAKYKLGLFDNPYKYIDESRAKKEIGNAANRSEARKIAADCFVLLRNKNNLLPLNKIGTIAVVGPLADNQENKTGPWSSLPDISLLDGLKSVAGDKAKIVYAKGSNLDVDAAFEERVNILQRDNRSADEMIQEALNASKDADVIIAALGESVGMTGESSSRSNLDIPEPQKDLLKALLKTGKPVVLVLFTGRPLTIKWENDHVPAILNVWFGGSEAGYAIADVLFGEVNPSAKLTTTWPQNVGQIPLYYNHKNTGRPLGDGKWFEKFHSAYLDVSNDPVYPFGYGLSYTTFSYSDIKLSNALPRGHQTVTASVTVTNTGNRDGKEVVQFYIHDVVGINTRPVQELKGFQKIALKAGESTTVSFHLGVNDLKYYHNDMKYDWEPGEFEIMIGSHSKNVKVSKLTWIK